MENKNDGKLVITMNEMQEQLDVSAKTIHKMIRKGDLPEFTYGSGYDRKKGWHKAVLEQHALDKYEKLQSLKAARSSSQVGSQDMSIPLFRCGNRLMSQQLGNFKDWNTPDKKLSCKKMS